MATKKSRTNITLLDKEKTKLEKLSELWGISQSRVVGRLLQEYELPEFIEQLQDEPDVKAKKE